MSLRKMLLVGLLLVLAGLPKAVSSQVRGGAQYFEGARLIIGDKSAPIENSAFVVEGDHFTCVGKKGDCKQPTGATRVDLTGKTVIPSPIDGHNHIGLVNVRDGSNAKANYTRENMVDQLQRYAYYGVSATLSMGLEQDQELAYKLRDETIPNAARFLTVGKGIAATRMGGPTGEARLGIPWGAANPEEGRKHVQELRARNVHFVKIWVDDREGAVPKLTPATYRAIIDEAHKNGMEVLAHLSRTSALADAKDLMKAGIDGFVHLVRDRDVDDEYLAIVKAHPKVWSGPNMPGAGATKEQIDALAETLPADQIARLRADLERRVTSKAPPNDLYQLHCRNLKKIHDAGMVIGLGTDGTGDGFGVHEQMYSYTNCGMTAAEAIMAATSINARILGLTRMGTVAVGKEASFNVLDANPLDNIINSYRGLSTVYLRGAKVDRAALRARMSAGGKTAN